ncbi:MAG: MBL fold metallo-hydrolase [Clostridia bacterium]|nr:MBL fold metallo-hydrolase [Clostridia bacterium]
MNIKINCHSSIKIESKKIIYFDPFRIKEEKHDADIIFITHDHYDHYSEEDVKKVINENTIIVAPKTIEIFEKAKNIVRVEPNEKYEVLGIKIETIPAYNINKKFHPKENNWVGYIIEIGKERYYIPGDTDITPENQEVKCDIAFLPIGGTYTMEYKEAAELTNKIKPKIVIPIHYGSIVGTIQDAISFRDLLDENIECNILIK